VCAIEAKYEPLWSLAFRPMSRSNRRTTRAEGRVLGLTVITIALYVVTWQLEGAMFRDGNVVRSVGPPAPASAYLQWAAYTAATLLVFWAYAALISMSVRGELDSGRARSYALLAPILLNLMFLLYVPRLSMDTLSYLGHGFLGQLPGGNPLLQPVQDASDTAIGPELAAYGWHTFPGITPYGILWTRLEMAIAQLSGMNVWAAILLFKAIATGASLGSAWLVWRILGHIDPAVQLQGTLAYLWNPLILMELAGEGHNDAVMILFSLAALAAAIAGRPAISLIAQLLGGMSKYVSVLFLPAQLTFLWRTRRDHTQLAWQVLVALTVTAVILVVSYAPLWAGLHSFDGIVHRPYTGGSVTFFSVIRWILKHTPLRPLAGPLTTVLVTGLLLAVIAWSSLYVRDAVTFAKSCAWISLAFALIVCPEYWPWYACMPIAWICVGEFRRLFWLVFLLALFGRLTAPLELLRIHGHLGFNLSKGLTTGAGALLPLVLLLVWGFTTVLVYPLRRKYTMSQ
jgi:alpha-1,6-mannosyltransferase